MRLFCARFLLLFILSSCVCLLWLYLTSLYYSLDDYFLLKNRKSMNANRRQVVKISEEFGKKKITWLYYIEKKLFSVKVKKDIFISGFFTGITKNANTNYWKSSSFVENILVYSPIWTGMKTSWPLLILWEYLTMYSE